MITFRDCIAAYFACKKDNSKPCYSCPCNKNKILRDDGVLYSFCDILSDLEGYFDETKEGEE